MRSLVQGSRRGTASRPPVAWAVNGVSGAAPYGLRLGGRPPGPQTESTARVESQRVIMPEGSLSRHPSSRLIDVWPRSATILTPRIGQSELLLTIGIIFAP
jgi:hypothetical protein